MFTSHSECLLGVVDLEIHLDCQLRFASTYVGGFSFAVLPSVTLNKALGLVDQDGISGLWLILAGNSECGVEISDVLIHADGFLRLPCLHELSLCLFVSFFVF